MARDAVVARPSVRLGLVVLTGGLLAGCGGSSGSGPGSPTAATTPTPGPSPPPPTATFLHLRREGGDIATYRLDAATGHLQFALDQRLGDVHALAGDPGGRYVYAAYGPRNRSAAFGEDASIVLHSVDGGGSLVPLSEAWSRPWPASPGSCTFGDWGWRWLSASTGRVWGLWQYRFGGGCQHDAYVGVTHVVTAGGGLGPAVSGDLGFEFGGTALDAGADVIYREHYAGYDSPGALTAHVVGPDHRLRAMGWTTLCLASEVYEVRPLVATRGFVFGHADLTGSVCSWEGPRLAPRGNLGIDASTAAAFSPGDLASPALLAMTDDVAGPSPRHAYQRTILRLLSVAHGGDVALLDAVDLKSRAWQLLFDPSGRFLFVADEEGTLYSFGVSDGSRLEPIESVPADARPARAFYYPSQPPFLAVSARPGVPRL